MLFNNRDCDTKQRFSIRKLSIGVCSVLLSTLFLTMSQGQTVHAGTGNVSTTDQSEQSEQTTGTSGSTGKGKDPDTTTPTTVSDTNKSQTSTTSTSDVSASSDTQNSGNDSGNTTTGSSSQASDDTSADTSSSKQQSSSDTSSSNSTNQGSSTESTSSANNNEATGTTTGNTDANSASNAAKTTATTEKHSPFLILAKGASTTADVTVSFVDDTDSSTTAPSDYTLSDQTVGDTLSSSTALADDTALANYDIVASTYTVADSDNKWTVHLTHKTETLTSTSTIPTGATNEDGSAVTSSDFSKTVTRTITYDYADKTPATTVQSTTLTRTGTYDLVTKKVTWGDYSTGSFARINTPSDGNYTPSMRYIQPVSDVTADFVDPQIVITYAVATQRFVKVETVDDDDNETEVADATVQSYYGATINVNDLSSTSGKLLIPSGYELASGQSATITVPDKNLTGSNAVKIHLVHKTATAAATDVDPATGKTVAEETQSLHTTNFVVHNTDGTTSTLATLTWGFKRTATKDLVDGTITYGNWKFYSSEPITQSNMGYYWDISINSTDYATISFSGEGSNDTDGTLAADGAQELYTSSDQMIYFTNFYGNGGTGSQTEVVANEDAGSGMFANTANTIRYTLSAFDDVDYDAATLPTDLPIDVPATVNITLSTGPQIQYTFVDDDESDAQVGSTVTVSGTAGSTYDTGLTIPDGYEIASIYQAGTSLGTTLPTSVTLSKINNPVTIHLTHKKAQVSSASDWSTYGIASDDQVALTKDVTRTISYVNVDDSSATVPSTTTQTVSFGRTAIVDEVTKKVVGYVDPSDSTKTVTDSNKAWKQTSTSDQWDAYTIPTLPSGYAVWRVDSSSAPSTTSSTQYTNTTTAQSGEITGIGAQTGITATTSDVNAVVVLTNLWYRVQEVDDDDNGTVIGTGYITRSGLNTNITMHFNDGITIANYEGVSVGDTATGTSMPTGFTLSYDGTDEGTLASPKGQYKVNGSYGTYAQASAAGVFGKTYTIHVKHKTEAVTDTSETQQTRQITVKYVNAKTGESMGSLAPDAVLDVYYKRTATKDLVTGNVTYGTWTWDKSRGDSATPGYHVVSGTWGTKATNGGTFEEGLPETFAIVAAEVPTVSGYTAFTKGDWEKSKNGVTSVPADEFVAPTWSENGQEAYQSDVSNLSSWLYEALPTHTVYYAPDETATRTVTAHFRKWENGADAGEAAPDSQVEFYLKKAATAFATNGSTDSTKWTITYGGKYTLDTSKGDTSTPGFTVKSGSWNDLANPTGGFSAVMPTIDGYTQVSFRDNLANTTDTFDNPNNQDDTAFTTATGDWVYRNSLTTYYVPNSDLTKTATRTINVTDPTTGKTTTTTQTVTFNRIARVNSDDNGVVFGALKNNGIYSFVSGDDLWNSAASADGTTNYNATATTAGNPTGTWASLDVTKAGYTALIDGTVGTTVPEQTGIAYDTADKTVNVTYVQNTANITITGSYTKTFDDTAATIPTTDITNAVTAGDTHLTLPTGSDSVTLDSDDFSWTDADGNALTSAPTKVGTYHIVLNDTGLNKFKALSSNFTWNYDPKTSYVTYTIKAASATAALSGSASKTYDGKAASLSEVNGGTIAVTLNFPGATDSNKTYTLQSGDYTWNTSDGSTPTTVGDYTITLTDTGKTHLQAAIDAAVGSGNVTLASSDATGSADFKINQATATVTFSSGTQSVNYNGTADQFDTSKFTPTISTNNGVTLTVPSTASLSVADGDFSFTDSTGTVTTEPTELGTYTVKLTDHGLAKLESDTTNYKWTNNASGTYTINKADDTTVTLNNVDGGQSETYKDAAYTNSDINVADYSVTLGNGKTYTLVSGDLEFVPSEDPTDAGTYKVELSAQGKENIAKVDSTHYSYTFDGAGTGKFTITKATPTVSFSGDAEKTYDGTPISNYAPTLTITAPGNPSTTLTAGTDYVWVDSTGTQSTTAPSAVGTYTVKLTSTGLNKITTLNSNNLDWSSLTVTSAGTGTYKIDQASATGTLAGSGERDYTGKTVTSAELTSDGNIAITLTIPAGENTTAQTLTYDLQDGDYTWSTSDGSAPKDAGTYTITLNKDKVLANIESAITNDATWKGNVKVTADDLSGSATFTINQVKATINLSGHWSETYYGRTVLLPSADLKFAIQAPGMINGDALDMSALSDDSYDWYASDGITKLSGAPDKAGTYIIKINDTGIAELNSKNPNYHYTIGSTNKYTFVLNKADGSVDMTNTVTTDYTGTADNDIYSKFPLTLSLDKFTRWQYVPSAGDLEFSSDGNTWTTTVPVNAGTYQVRLSTAGWTNLVAKNNPDSITWSKDRITGTATYKINQIDATADLTGSNSKTFDNKAVTTDQINNGGSIKVTITANGKTIDYTLQNGDYTWNTTDGTAPTNVGNYTFKLNKSAILSHLQDKINADSTLNGNVIIKTTDLGGGTAIYDITAPTVTITQQGSGSKTYDGQTANVGLTTLQNSDNWSTTGFVSGAGLDTSTLTASDFDWYNGSTKLDSAPTNAGTYTLKLNANGLAHLQAANSNYSFDSVAGSYTYTINKANATISLNENDNSQTATWDGSKISLDLSKFKPTITTDNSNQSTISLPSTLTLNATDYVITQNGATATPKEPGTYSVSLTTAGWQKVRDAISGNANYNWTSKGNGKLTINKASATITLNGSSSVTYTGNVATIPTSSYSVTLSNGQTYTLQDGDLEFASSGNTNVGDYTVKLSAAGLQHIEDLDSNHYTYTYDNGTAKLTIAPAAATATITGSDSKVYDGTAASLSGDKYSVTLSNGQTYTLKSGDYAFANTDGTIINAPTNHGSYKVVLTDQGKSNIENLTKVGSVQNYTWGFASNATYEITAQKMAIVVTGEASKTYDGTNAIITNADLAHITLRWGNNTTAPSGVTYTLSADDLEVVDASGNPVSAANYYNGALISGKGTYYIVLKDSVLTTIQSQNKNYEFSLSATTTSPTTSNAIYKIYRRKAALTVSGSQTVNYGDLTALDKNKFTVDLSNWTDADGTKPIITLQDGDLEIDPAGTTTENGVPVNVGNYTVKMTSQLINRLKNLYTNYDFDEVDSSKDSQGNVQQGTGQDATHNPALYIVQAKQIEVTLSGKQTIKYGEANTINPDDYQISFSNIANRDKSTFDSFKLQASDLTFVTTPGDVGSYQVKLSESGIARLKALGTNFSTNYDWSQNVDNARADFEVVQMPLTVTVSDASTTGHQTITYGQTPTINNSDYTISVKTEDGAALAYTPVAGDLTFANGTPTNVGTYDVVLSSQGLQNIKTKFGTKNYTYKSTGNGNFEIQAAKATIGLKDNGTPGKIYDDIAASLNSGDYTLTITTNNGSTFNYTLSSKDLRFVDASGNTITAPTNAGTYKVALTTSAISAIEALDGNSGKNYTWKFDQTADYKISAAKGTATLGGKVSKTYDGSAIDLNSGTDPITVTVSYPGASSTTYTLQAGDYEFVDSNGIAYTTAPVDIGNYTIQLTQQGKDNIAKLGNSTTATNIDWTGSNAISGTGTYDITARDITVTVPSHEQDETYDGSAKKVDLTQLVPTLSTTDGVTVPTIPEGTLVNDDYTIKDADGNIVTNPTKVGTYTITLNSNGIAALKKLSSNFNWPTSATGSGKLVIAKAKATAALSGSNEKSYNGATTTTTEVNSNGQIVVKISIPNSTKTISYTLQDGDYTWADGSAPTNVGTYTIFLNKVKILAHLQSAIANDSTWNGNVDLSADNLSGTASFKINAVAGSASLSGQNHQDYNGSAVTTAEVNSNGDIKVTISVAGLDHTVSYTLANGDYDWYNGSTKLNSAPTNVGTYTIKLNNSALAKLQAAIANDSTFKGNVTLAQNAVSGSATYTINAIGANVSLDENNKQTEVFNGDTIALDLSDFVPTISAGNVTVPVIPTTGSSALTADDFTITDQDGNVVHNPKNAGTYKVTLNSQGLAKLARLSSNFTWPTTASGHGTLIIKAATANASLSGSNQKVYDGTAVTTAEVNAGGNITVKVAYSNTPATSFPFMTLAYVNGDNILTYTLQDGDYTWDTSDHSAPTNVGTYHISLTKQGMQNIQKAIDQQVGKGNVALTDKSAGTAEYKITPFKLNITVDGSTTVPSGTTTIPDNTYSLDYSSGETGLKLPTGLVQPTGKLDASQLEFIGAAPTKDTAGQSFIVGYKGGQTALQTLLGDNYQVKYTNPVANYHVSKESSQTVEYVDDKGEVIKTLDPIIGDKGTEVAFDNAANMPTNWVLADGETAPTSIKIEGGITQIKIKHGTKEITIHNNDDWPRNVYKDDFQREITRTINVTDPSGHTTTTEQIVQFTRTGIKDLVTNLVTWNAWTPATGTWAEFDTPTIDGYTPSQSKVDAQTVTVDTKDTTVNITYTPNSVGPDNPDNPSQPTGATKPTAPTKPVTPTKPNKPHKPGKPTKPNKPHKPGKPQKPAQPKQPNVPASKPNNSNSNFGPKYAEHRQNYQTKGELHRVHRLADGTIVGPEGEAYAGSAAKTANGKKTLPQTGEKNNEFGILGSLLASLGLFGLAGTRKRRKKDQ